MIDDFIFGQSVGQQHTPANSRGLFKSDGAAPTPAFRKDFPTWAPDAAVARLEQLNSQGAPAHYLIVMRRLLCDDRMNYVWKTLIRRRVEPAWYAELATYHYTELKNEFALAADYKRREWCEHVVKHAAAIRDGLANLPNAFASDVERMAIGSLEARAKALAETSSMYGKADKDQVQRAFAIDLTKDLLVSTGKPLRRVVALTLAAAFELTQGAEPNDATITNMAPVARKKL